MTKNLKLILAILLLISILLPITYSYALEKTNQNMNNKLFFEISKLEVNKNEKVEMTLNLDSIKYNNFIFKLQSSETIQNIEITQNNNVETEKNNNEIVMEINKEKININTINLYYIIPQNKNVGDIIKFVATITDINDEENEQSIKDQTTNEIDTQSTIEQQEINKIELEVKIVGENSNNLNNNQNLEKNDMSSTNQKMSAQGMPTNAQNSAMSSSSQTLQVVYKGSDNNYLSELFIEGYELNKEYSKDNTTYFVTVGNEIEKLDIEAVADDSNATTTVYGNENLKEGTNKVLISVTAENGNVRNYRIYVTRKA